jgi:hypothetical protein
VTTKKLQSDALMAPEAVPIPAESLGEEPAPSAPTDAVSPAHLSARHPAARALAEDLNHVPAEIEPKVAERNIDRYRWRSLFRGMGSVLEIFPPPRSYLPQDTLEEAIAGIWAGIGSDLCAAIEQTKYRVG